MERKTILKEIDLPFAKHIHISDYTNGEPDAHERYNVLSLSAHGVKNIETKTHLTSHSNIITSLEITLEDGQRLDIDLFHEHIKERRSKQWNTKQ